MSEAKEANAPEQNGESVLEHFWPEHLSGQEVKTKWSRGRNATIERVLVEDVFDQQINKEKQMVVIYFEGIVRGLVTNKTNGRWLAKQFGGDADKWAGREVSIQAANRSNGTIGVDLGEPFEE
jgi:hypothetical protein